MKPSLQFGRADDGVVYLERPATFGLVLNDQKLACVRVTRDTPYYDLPGGAVDGVETEAEALIREFVEETGMAVRPVERIVETAQYFRKSDGSPVNNIGGIWIAEMLALDPARKVEDDHELVWLHPRTALAELRHDAHAWAVAKWLRHHA
ncbi:NUDIX domain-containing protein [soil metagenome]